MCYTDKTRVFDQSEHARGAIHIIMHDNKARVSKDGKMLFSSNGFHQEPIDAWFDTFLTE